ncbi:efflux RND transporter periplasmic adaptor subunit [Terribacillus saccharophilus]|uniref:efflux RND transporter periplasmic adaptor subunit n=1 Tax=Terribacillus saccharophilus TaxID=361277 RepID=UPI0039828639
MMKKIILPAGILLILINLAILFWDDGRVGRTNVVHKWEQVTAEDVKETMAVPAVLTSADMIPVRFDPQSGSITETLVEPGDTVEEGDDLFTYQTADYNKTYSELNSVITSLEQQTEAVEQAISDAEDAAIAVDAQPEETFESESIEESGSEEENDRATEALQQATEEQTIQMQEQYRIDLEKELAQKSAELSAAEEQLADLEETGEFITVTSPASGTVKTVAQTGDEPVVTLQSSDLVMAGELTEAERKQVQTGMTVEAKVTDDGPALEGEITDLADQPSAAGKESKYKFEAAYLPEEEQNDDLLAGYHLDMDILLAHDSQVPAVKPARVTDDRIWHMTNGELQTVQVELGAQNEKQAAIISGLEAGTFIPVDQEGHYANEPFVTPWKPQEMNWSQWKEAFTSYEFLLGIMDH